VGGTKGIDAQVFVIEYLLPRLWGMALSLGGSSKTLVLSNFPGLSQSFNGNGEVSIYSAFTNLHYPVFTEDRGKSGSLLPVTYKPTKESEYLINYTKRYVVDANKIKHHVEELQSIGYLVHEAMEQAVQDCRSGDEWDKGEFYICLKAMTLHHLQMTGAEWVNTKMGGYFTEQLLPRIIYQAAFHHARIPENEKPFQDTVLKDWLKTDWMDVVDDDAELMQVGWQGKLLEYGLKYGGQGTKFIQKGLQKAVQAYKGEIVKGLKIDKSVENKLTQQLGQPKLADKQIGLRWGDVKGNNQIRIMQGNSKMPHKSQHKDYVQVRRGGKVIGRDQKEVKPTSSFSRPGDNPEAHIPYEEWVNWRTLLGE
jgi:hypothetical protein